VSETNEPDAFFIGWSGQIPRPWRTFIFCVAVAAVGGLGVAGVALSSSVDDPGSGNIDWSAEQTLHAVLTSDPYPLLHLPPDALHPHGHVVLTAGEGKYGIQADMGTLENKTVEATGYVIKRGALDMIAVNDASGIRLDPATPLSSLEAPVQHGRWRIVGEICDGKCFTGIMRYGSGLAHKACASLCLRGSLAPVFVSTGPIEGSSFFLLADQNGKAVPEEFFRLAAVRIRLDGEVERRGDLLVFKANLASAKIL
jgi:hypothetical protein